MMEANIPRREEKEKKRHEQKRSTALAKWVPLVACYSHPSTRLPPDRSSDKMMIRLSLFEEGSHEKRGLFSSSKEALMGYCQALCWRSPACLEGLRH
jgi:hypothetical protein